MYQICFSARNSLSRLQYWCFRLFKVYCFALTYTQNNVVSNSSMGCSNGSCPFTWRETFGQPTQQSLERLFDELSIPENATFYDLGSGTGTVLFHAASLKRRPAKLIGVEFSATLHAEAIRRREALALDVQLLEKDITTMTDFGENFDDDPLYLFSFDARFPDVVVAHITQLIRRHIQINPRSPMVWITTFTKRGIESKLNATIGVKETMLNTKLFIGPTGVDENHIPPPIYNMAEQSENYTEEEWEAIDRADAPRARENLRRFIKDPSIPQLEMFRIFMYHLGGGSKQLRVENCIVCSALTQTQCSGCQLPFCSVKCQSKKCLC